MIERGRKSEGVSVVFFRLQGEGVRCGHLLSNRPNYEVGNGDGVGPGERKTGAERTGEERGVIWGGGSAGGGGGGMEECFLLFGSSLGESSDVRGCDMCMGGQEMVHAPSRSFLW